MTLELTKEDIVPLLVDQFKDVIDLDADQNLYINAENLHIKI